MPSFSGESPARPRRTSSSPPAVVAAQEYSLFPHPAARMFRNPDTNNNNRDLMDESSHSSSNNNDESRRLSTMKEDEDQGEVCIEEGDFFPAVQSSSPSSTNNALVEFSGLTHVIQADTEEAAEGQGSPRTFRSKKELPETPRNSVVTRSSMRSELKTITSGRTLTTFDSVAGQTTNTSEGAGQTNNNDLQSQREQQLQQQFPHCCGSPRAASTNSSDDGSATQSIKAGLRRLFPRSNRQSPSSTTGVSISPLTSPGSRSGVGTASPRHVGASYGHNNISHQMNSPTPMHSKTISRKAARRYQLGEAVLVSNHQSHWALLVNAYGFPPGEGERPEEQRGPYLYVLATVEQIHYDEYEVYYTVRRADNGAKQRSDAQFMEPVLSEEGEMAAQRAATRSVLDYGGHGAEEDEANDVDLTSRERSNSLCKACGAVGMTVLYPVFVVARSMAQAIQPVTSALLSFLRKRAVLILNGDEPYACQIRWTAVNFVVLCAIWYMFIDQARLAVFPPDADNALAIINLVVWLVLVLELLFECFIRPDGYRFLILSDKAYSPDIVRYINAFHLLVEFFSLVLFMPEFYCLFRGESCGTRYRFSFHHAALLTSTAATRQQAFYGRAYLAAVRLRVFGLVRHWKTMWINNIFLHRQRDRSQLLNNLFPARMSSNKKQEEYASSQGRSEGHSQASSFGGSGQASDETLTNASTIGTALMVTNSYRSLVTMWIILGLLPLIFTGVESLSNGAAQHITDHIQVTYDILASVPGEPADNGVCDFVTNSTHAWAYSLLSSPSVDHGAHFLTVEVDTELCEGAIDVLSDMICERLGLEHAWDETYIDSCKAGEDLDVITSALGLRSGSVVEYSSNSGTSSVKTYFDQTNSIETAAQSSCLLQLCMLVIILGGLSVMRRDAEVLVLGPLRRMLKIVARYAKNPLSQPKLRRRYSPGIGRRKLHRLEREDYDDDTLSESSSECSDDDHGDLALGSYETEQLITAVTVITDLLRKCWGVAGAGIISTNLASTGGALTEVFNPTVPGKSVYALFGFAAINGFDHAMRSLGDDLIDLINNVAKVLHEEIFRWGFGDSGQCNKNLGSAFLMVFRIGLVKEVIQKLEQAQDVIFSGTKAAQEAVRRRVRHTHSNNSDPSSGVMSGPLSHRGSSGGFSSTSSSTNTRASGSILRWTDYGRRKAQRNAKNKAMSLNLASLPGIATFTDRAVIGMLKSFACMYRDKDIRKWNKDFRLGAGVGAFTVSIFYGMDAGWAVEGAVGSQYKIDATYLSPHVNMASRMMSACKQYGVSILLSQAVQELMSDTGRSKLRHLDTVTVKGSIVKQKIFTYDARHKGVDFFLFGRTDEQAEMDAERYSHNIWNTDQDLKAMRQHITDEFLYEFQTGHKAYITGDWPVAIKRLERANEIMIEAAVENGYLEDEFDAIQMHVGEDAREAVEELKRENGDGPSLYLINFMKSQGGFAPRKWEGWHPLNRK